VRTWFSISPFLLLIILPTQVVHFVLRLASWFQVTSGQKLVLVVISGVVAADMGAPSTLWALGLTGLSGWSHRQVIGTRGSGLAGQGTAGDDQ
jgi:hypothetical protein